MTLDGGRLTVTEMDNHRITLVHFQDTAINEDGTVGLADTTSAPDEEEQGLLHRLRAAATGDHGERDRGKETD